MRYDEQPSPADLRSAMQTLQGLGVATIEVEFSGGNDEGGADGISYLDADGNEVSVPKSNAYEDEQWNSTTKRFDSTGWQVRTGDWKDQTTRPATDEEVLFAKIAQIVEYPIYERYGSFAGEFYVYGTLRWDVAAGTHKMEGQESHEVWESI